MKISTSRKLVAVLAVLGFTVGTAAATTTYDCKIVTDDAMILTDTAGNGSSNANGRGPGMFAGADGGGSKKRSLVKFSLADCVTGMPTLASVQLDLVIGQIAGSMGMGPGCGMSCTPSSRTFEIYQVDYTHAWTEGQTGATACSGPLGAFSRVCPSINGTGQGWPYASCSGTGFGASCGGDVTWEYYNYSGGVGSSWGNGPTNQDYGTGSFGSPSFGNHTAAGSWPFSNFLNNATMVFPSSSGSNPGLMAVVQDWINNPAHNNGLEIRGPTLEGINTSFIGWWTKDGASANSNTGLSPVLHVTY